MPRVMWWQVRVWAICEYSKFDTQFRNYYFGRLNCRTTQIAFCSENVPKGEGHVAKLYSEPWLPASFCKYSTKNYWHLVCIKVKHYIFRQEKYKTESNTKQSEDQNKPPLPVNSDARFFHVWNFQLICIKSYPPHLAKWTRPQTSHIQSWCGKWSSVSRDENQAVRGFLQTRSLQHVIMLTNCKLCHTD